jgi:quinol monooxygenase YgiN
MIVNAFRSWFLPLAALAFAGGTASQAPAQQPPPVPPRFAVAYVEVAPSSRDAFVAAFRTYRDASRRDGGFERLDLFEQTGWRGHFIVIEAWREPQDLEAHRAAAHVKSYRDAVDKIRTSGYDERPYRALSVGAASAAPGGAVHVIAHVDIGGQQPNAPAMLSQLAEESRKERGALRFDVLQNTTRQNHFTVIESWADEAAFNAHAAAAHTRRYRDTLQPISGSPLDERLARAVD